MAHKTSSELSQRGGAIVCELWIREQEVSAQVRIPPIIQQSDTGQAVSLEKYTETTATPVDALELVRVQYELYISNFNA